MMFYNIEMRNWITLGACGFVFLNFMTAAETRWIRIASSNFDMYTTAGERSARATLQYFEQVRSFFAQTMPHPLEESVRVRIVAFNSLKEYEPYRLNEFATAYYHSTADHDYIVMSHTGAETFPTAIHEYVHLVVQHSKLKFPPWLNEGIAELYSTLKPMGDKILVGSLIAGRHQALLQDKWVPLATIMAAGHDSPYYNEKNKAGNLYNEGWALTHMLALSPEYRPKFSEILRSISGGTPSADALEQIYSKPMNKIENDLLVYLRGGRFQGVLIPAKLEKIGDDLDAEPADVFDLRLLLADVADRPSREDATRKAFEELAAQNPNRAEVYIALAYLDWRQKRSSDALEHFAKAFELGSRNPRMLWDYGRMTESADAAKSIEALRELLRLEPERLDVHLELASMQLRSHAPKEALQSLVPVKKVTPEDAPRVLTLLAYANLEAGDRVMARNAAEQLKKVSTTIEERSQADRILQFIEAARSNTAKPVLAFEESDDLPGLNRRDAAPEALRPVVRRPSLTGKFVDLECEEHAKVVIETAEGKKFFLIEDPSKLLVNGKSGETMDLSCGPQKPVQIRIEYDPPGLNRPGIDGVVRVIRFDQ
jgi:tetratricopeptide (TPR) repeat protein